MVAQELGLHFQGELVAFCGNKFGDLGEEGERNPEPGSARPGMAGARRSSEIGRAHV